MNAFARISLFVVGLVTSPLASAQTSTQEEASKVRCIVVGVDDYESGVLTGCTEDVAQVASFLKTRFGPKRTSVKAIVDKPDDKVTASWHMIKDAIDECARDSTSIDYFYFYYSGHGDNGILQLPNEDVKASDLASALAKVKALMTCVIIDACHSGSLVTKLDEEIKSQQLVLVMAVADNQTSKTCRVDGALCPASSERGSIFTRWLVDAMQNKSNDTNRDGAVSWREAQDAAASKMADKKYREYLKEFPWYRDDISLDMTPVFRQRL